MHHGESSSVPLEPPPPYSFDGETREPELEIPVDEVAPGPEEHEEFECPVCMEDNVDGEP